MLYAVGDPSPVRWSVWLAAGVVLGLALGFVVGLAKPRLERRRSEEEHVDNAFSSTSDDKVGGQGLDPRRAERARQYRIRK